jgi:hypothetical protein
MSTIHETGTSARSVKHDDSFRFKCAHCGGIFGKGDGSGSGYAVAPDDSLICYACMGVKDRADLEAAKPGERFTHYMEADGTITNWPGTMKIRPHYVKRGRHNIGRTRTDAWFTFGGKPFHAVQIGEHNQIARIRALKP